jgi:phosphohistidine phosphatase
MKRNDMKTLTIMRHAKSSWAFPDLTDEERPLIEKGIHRTGKTCRFIKEEHILPEAIFSSPAVRAIETAHLVCKQLNLVFQPIVVESFYPGEPDYYLAFLKKVDSSINHVMIIGHNPGVSNFACELLSNQVAEWIPTSGCAIIQLPIQSWTDAAAGKGKLKYYVEPKKL